MKNCTTCDFRKRLYDEALPYYPRKLWCCTYKDEILTSNAACEHWRKIKREYDLSPARFDSVEDDLRVLMKLLRHCEERSDEAIQKL